MPFISQTDLSASLRSRSEKEYRSQLRAALLHPGISAEQRREIQTRLAQVGQPKVYDAATPPVPGAVALPQTEPTLTSSEIQGMKKVDLQALASQRGLSSEGTRVEIIKRLLAAQE